MQYGGSLSQNIFQHTKDGSLGLMKMRFIGIFKIDPNQACGTAFLFCPSRVGKKVSTVWTVEQTVCLHLRVRKKWTSGATQRINFQNPKTCFIYFR